MSRIPPPPKGYDPYSDSEYMSLNMQAYFKKRLEDMRDRLLRKENELSLSHIETSPRESDNVDLGTNNEIDYQDFCFQEYETNLRTLVEEALQRLEEGTYGYCQETGEPIGVKRLVSVPYARFCLAVQQQKENEAKRFRP